MDLGLLLALLAAAAAGVVEARAEAAHVVLAWRAGSRGVPRAATALFIAALHARPRPHGRPASARACAAGLQQRWVPCQLGCRARSFHAPRAALRAAR